MVKFLTKLGNIFKRLAAEKFTGKKIVEVNFHQGKINHIYLLDTTREEVK